MNTSGAGSRTNPCFSRKALLPAALLALSFAASLARAESFTGELGGADGKWEAWLPVSVASDGTFSTQMTVSGDLNGGNSGHCLYDSTKTNSFPYACSFTSPLGPWGLKAGTYYLKVWTNSAGRGTYAVSTTFSAQTVANDGEPNGTYALASSVANSGTLTGHLGYWNIAGSQNYDTDWEDWRRVTLPVAGTLRVTYTSDQALAGSTGTYLYQQDGSTLLSSNASSLAAGMQLAAGTYYLRTWNNNGSAFGAYTLALTIPGLPAPATPPSGSISAIGPITNQTLTLKNIQINSADLANGVSLYIAALAGNVYYFFNGTEWTDAQVPYRSGITTAPGPVTLASGDMRWLIGTPVLLGYGNGTGSAALNDLLESRKYAQIYTITDSNGSGSSNLLDLARWSIYGSGQVFGTALEFGDEIGGDFGDEDKDNNPDNVWNTGAVSDNSGFGFDVDWAVARSTFTAPFTIRMNACLSYAGPENRLVIGRENIGFSNASGSPDPLAQEIYVQGDWTQSNASLVLGTRDGATARSSGAIPTTMVAPGPSAASRTPYDYEAICGDYEIEWKNQVVELYFNDNKVGEVPYSSGYGEAFALGFLSFANPIKVNSFVVEK
jgi:hypothetical protein